MQTYIKQSNYWMIIDFATTNSRKELQGNKLQALYRLIQKKGEPVKADDHKIDGLKALQISEMNLFVWIEKHLKKLFTLALFILIY